MNSFKSATKISGLIVFVISFIVYFLTAERTGSLWDCGEFVLGAYKLQVVHPPGAPLFMLVGRFFTFFAEMFSSNPSDIAFAVNLMSGFFSAIGATLAGWTAMIFGKSFFKDRNFSKTDLIALTITGVTAGLTTAFCSSIWFSAVEGEVYALSTFFTILTFWSALKWYDLPDKKESDKWLVFSMYAGALSIGVHLLSLLAFPAIALLFYFKKYKKVTFLGIMASLAAGVFAVIFVMKIVIVGIPSLWQFFEIPMVNKMGMPFHSGLIPVVLLIGAAFYGLLRIAHQKKIYLLQLFTVGALMCVVGFSTLGVIVIRAAADTPINMNVPSDAVRLLPYLNREQYGERPLVLGTTYKAEPQGVDREERYGRVGDKYEIVDEKYSYRYSNRDKILFPRIGHGDGNKPGEHEKWRQYLNNGKKPSGRPGMAYNLSYMWNYQFNWMYFRYFLWNFAGRQNGEQGHYKWDVRKGHWASGINALDKSRTYDTTLMPEDMKSKASNKYFFLPFLLGLIGLFFHASASRREFSVLMVLFLITGLGIILYSNQPPNEPRERDYVLTGSFFAYSVWIGLAVLAIYNMLKERMSNKMVPLGISALALFIPLLMAFQNFDDHDRSEHYAARDYAANFLRSCEPNSIIFTYGDNDTYPLWYAQEVEGIRTDVRVVNLSLIAVDWYIEKMNKKVNDSEALKFSLPMEAYRGIKRNQLWFINSPEKADKDRPRDFRTELNYIKDDRSILTGQDRKGKLIKQYTLSTRDIMIPVDIAQARKSGMLWDNDTSYVTHIPVRFKDNASYITKDELAILDILGSNINDRPIYFAVTCNPTKFMGLENFFQLEGMGLRLVPVRSQGERDLYIYGNGRIDVDRCYDIVMNKWKWGNFDGEKTFINGSYGAAVQAMKMIMIRTALNLSEQKDHKRASDVAKKYFESFPHHNFQYDGTVFPFIGVLIEAKEFDSAKKHMEILAKYTQELLIFYESLDERAFNSFSDDFRYAMRAANDVLNNVESIGDDAFTAKIQEWLGEYDIRKYENDKTLKR